jgi:hypothetical protein
MNWIDHFKLAFDAIQGPLSSVFDAESCREGWLQGELYRRLVAHDKQFRVNHYVLPAPDGSKRPKADLYGENPARMVAEMKILGTFGYYQKNIDGNSNINAYLPSDSSSRVDVTQDHLDRVNSGVSSVLRDYQRLKSITDDVEKYLILVIRTDEKPDRFGKAILAIRCSMAETTFEYPKFTVRVWRL